jgi:sugar lactone lactonase YvrE
MRNGLHPQRLAGRSSDRSVGNESAVSTPPTRWGSTDGHEPSEAPHAFRAPSTATSAMSSRLYSARTDSHDEGPGYSLRGSLFASVVVIATVAVAASAPPLQDSSAADPAALYAQRESFANLMAASASWEARLKKDSRDYESAWKLSRACHAIRLRVSGYEAPNYIKRGLESAKRAIKIDSKRPEGHFWHAVHLGVLNDRFGVELSLNSGMQMKRALDEVIEIDPSFESGLAHAVLGRWYFRTPKWLGGNRKKAAEYFRRAFAFEPRPAASALYFAEFLIEEERLAEARSELVKLAASPIDSRWDPDDQGVKERAARLVQALDATARTATHPKPQVATQARSDALSFAVEDPSSIVIDDVGNLIVADTRNHRILKVTPEGSVFVIAGTGDGGYSGDGGPAARATLNRPTGVALDRDGRLFIADTRNHVVRAVDKAGVITTIAGSGKKGYSGDGQRATSAQLQEPFDIEVESDGTLYVADGGNLRIRKVTPDGAIHTALKLAVQPFALALDQADNLYISQFRKVLKYSHAGRLETVAGSDYQGGDGDGREATNARFANILGLAVDSEGAVYLSDQNALRIRKVGSDGIVTTVAGNPAFNALSPFDSGKPKLYMWPTALAVDKAGTIYFGTGGDAWADYVGPPTYTSPTLGGLAAANVQIIQQTVRLIGLRIIAAKDADYLPWNGARFILKQSKNGEASPVLGKVH